MIENDIEETCSMHRKDDKKLAVKHEEALEGALTKTEGKY
jgi:hypothetical protein